MTDFDEADWWAHRFGLARVPLFECEEPAEKHHVLLDGGYGSFALSLTDERIWSEGGASELGLVQQSSPSRDSDEAGGGCRPVGQPEDRGAYETKCRAADRSILSIPSKRPPPF
jgi:hypothetical protein